MDFLSAASAEFAGTGVVLTARRCLASIEGGAPVMFIGVELSLWEGEARTLPWTPWAARSAGSRPRGR